MKVKKVCRRCYGHAVSIEDVTTPTRAIRPYMVSTTGCAHKPNSTAGGQHTECGLLIKSNWEG